MPSRARVARSMRCAGGLSSDEGQVVAVEMEAAAQVGSMGARVLGLYQVHRQKEQVTTRSRGMRRTPSALVANSQAQNAPSR